MVTYRSGSVYLVLLQHIRPRTNAIRDSYLKIEESGIGPCTQGDNLGSGFRIRKNNSPDQMVYSTCADIGSLATSQQSPLRSITSVDNRRLSVIQRYKLWYKRIIYVSYSRSRAFGNLRIHVCLLNN